MRIPSTGLRGMPLVNMPFAAYKQPSLALCTKQITAMDGLHRQALLACAEIRHSAELQHLLERQLGCFLAAGEVEETVQPMPGEGWLVQEGDCLFSVTVSLR